MDLDLDLDMDYSSRFQKIIVNYSKRNTCKVIVLISRDKTLCYLMITTIGEMIDQYIVRLDNEKIICSFSSCSVTCRCTCDLLFFGISFNY